MSASPYSQFIRSSYYYIPYKDGSAESWRHRWDRLTRYPVDKALCLDFQWSHPDDSYGVLLPNGSVHRIVPDEPQPSGEFEVFDLWVDNLLAR